MTHVSLSLVSVPLTVLALALALVGCGGSPQEPSKKSAKPATQPGAPAAGAQAPSASADAGGDTSSEPAAAEPSDGAYVRLTGAGGRAILVGTPPKTSPLPIGEEAAKGCSHDGAPLDRTDRSLLISAEGGIANVVVEIEVKGVPAVAGAEPVVLDQIQCRFDPHVTVVPAGTTVEYLNSDSISHNVNVTPRRAGGMNAMVEGGKSRAVTYTEQDQIQVKCDIHTWMGSWIVVSEASHTALSDAAGKFQLPGLPPGKHKVSCWHESLGSGKGTLSVGPDGAIEDLEIALGRRTGR